jgi:hypothetical protein
MKTCNHNTPEITNCDECTQERLEIARLVYLSLYKTYEAEFILGEELWDKFKEAFDEH